MNEEDGLYEIKNYSGLIISDLTYSQRLQTKNTLKRLIKEWINMTK